MTRTYGTFVNEFFDNASIYYVGFVRVAQMLNQRDINEVKMATHHVL